MTTRDASVDWVRRALADELRSTSATIRTRALNLVGVAELHGRSIEELVAWIHTPAPDKQWTAAEFRRYCESTNG